MRVADRQLTNRQLTDRQFTDMQFTDRHRTDRAGTLAAACAAAAEWPRPGGGRTLERWSALAALAGEDLVTARLVEAHADAVAIIAELCGGGSSAGGDGGGQPAGGRENGADRAREPRPAGSRWGVWAAEGPGSGLAASRDGAGWSVTGTKPWCSGATLLTHALVTARRGDERRLFAVALADPGVTAGPDDWAAAGMKGADTRTVRFDRVAAQPVGGDGDYLGRPGFWAGGLGVAACWYGGTVALAGPLRSSVATRGADRDPHAAAHLGAVDVALGGARDSLRAAAAELDAHPSADHARLARRVRGAVAQAATDVSVRVGRALGPGPLASNPAHARRVADLEVYVRQDHAERDLAALGAALAAAGPPGDDAGWADWWL